MSELKRKKAIQIPEILKKEFLNKNFILADDPTIKNTLYKISNIFIDKNKNYKILITWSRGKNTSEGKSDYPLNYARELFNSGKWKFVEE